MTTRSSILAWRIPWTEEPGGLQSMGLQRIRHELATKQQELLRGYKIRFHSFIFIEREGGSGLGTHTPVADSCQCMAKSIQYCKAK